MPETDTTTTDREAKPCELCEMEPDEDAEVVETTNRALFQVDKRYYITPMCKEHDDLSAEETVEQAYEYGGKDFVLDLVENDVVTPEEAHEHIPEDISV